MFCCSAAELGDDITDKLITAVHRTETLAHKEERLTEIKEGQKELYEAAPESLKSAIDFTKKFNFDLCVLFQNIKRTMLCYHLL